MKKKDERMLVGSSFQNSKAIIKEVYSHKENKSKKKEIFYFNVAFLLIFLFRFNIKINCFIFNY